MPVNEGPYVRQFNREKRSKIELLSTQLMLLPSTLFTYHKNPRKRRYLSEMFYSAEVVLCTPYKKPACIRVPVWNVFLKILEGFTYFIRVYGGGKW